MNLFGHRTCCKAGAKARSPLAPVLALATGAGGVLPIMRANRGVGGERVGGRESSSAPLPGAPNVGFRVSADPLDLNTRVRAEISPSAYLHLTALLGSKL